MTAVSGLVLAGELDLGADDGASSVRNQTLALSLRYSTPTPAFSGITGTPRTTATSVVQRVTSVIGVGATG